MFRKPFGMDRLCLLLHDFNEDHCARAIQVAGENDEIIFLLMEKIGIDKDDI